MLVRTPSTSARPAASSASPMARGQATALRDRQVAGVGAGTGHHVAGELGAGLGHAERLEALGDELASWSSARPRSTKFWRLVIRTSASSSRTDRRRCPGTASAVTSPRRLQASGRHRAVGDAPHDVGLLPACRRRWCRVSDTGTPWPMAVTGPVPRPAGASPRQHAPGRGCRPATMAEASRNFRDARMRSLQLLEAELVDQPLHAGPQLVVAVAGLLEHPHAGLERRAAAPRGA